MKTSVYVSDPKVRALCKEYGKTNDIGVMFDKVDNDLGLEHDDLARAMYVALLCGTGDKDNVATLLSMNSEKLLIEAYKEGEIGSEYLTRWCDLSTLEDEDA